MYSAKAHTELAQRLVRVDIHLEPSLYQSFVANSEGDIPEQ
jgi:hypothetical protein